MTDEMSREARALLEAARGGDEPGAAARERVRAKVIAAIGAGGAAGMAGGGTAAGVTTTAAAGATTATMAIVKVVLAVLVVAGGVVGVYFARGGGGEGAPRSDTDAVAEPAAAAAAAPAPAAAAAPAPAAAPAAAPAPEAAAAAEPAPAPAADPVPAKPTRKKLSAADSLRAEKEILARASAALRQGDERAALAAVAEHQKKFPKGVLVEERSATRVVALCEAGRTDEGTKARDAFLARWPRSVHAARVRSACGE